MSKSHSKRRLYDMIIIGILSVGILAPLSAIHPAHSQSDEVIPDFTSVPYDFFTLSPATTNPVLTAAQVTDRTATYIADCHMFHENNVWYMFFEVYSTVGIDIGLATSTDGLHWNYEQVVLDESFTVAYPEVFKWNGEYYMVPESYEINQIRLYKATSFPYTWTYVSTIISGYQFVDPSIFRYNNKWWMFAPTINPSYNVYLYSSDNLEDPASWTQHPKSPIVVGDASKARGGGRPTVFGGNRIIRLPQKCDVSYGEAVRAFEVDTLTDTDYAEHEIAESPILSASGSGWNSHGMHCADPWWNGDRWLVCADGESNGIYSLGIYASPQITEAPVVSNPSPAEDSTGVSLSLSQLSFDLSDSQSDPMSYTVTTQPDIGSGSGTGVGNGRYYVSVSGLSYGTTYSWSVHASDGTHSTDVTYEFTTMFLGQTVIPDWSSVAFNPFPLNPAGGITNPVIKPSDITDRSATMVFAPSIFHEGINWYMFMAVYGSGANDIGLATSTDGYHWAYQQIVLDESFDLSVPQVFKYGDTYYMLTEEWANNEVRLYRATNFPNTWSYVNSLISGRPFVSPTILLYGGTWWLFAGATGNAYCYLYYSDSLTDPASWHEHPSSPIVSNDASKARPGGRPIVLADDKIIRFAMKNDQSFGQAVRAFQIDTLTKTSYAEHEFPESPILTASGSGWNANGMHWIDPWYTGNRWIAAVDGVSGSEWSIGIYETPTVPEAPVVSNPLPADGGTQISLSLSQLSFDLTDYQGDQMSYTVTTEPNIGGDSGTGVGKGRYYVSVSGLAYGTTYSWLVHASDGTHSADVTYTFTTVPPEPPVVPDWSSVTYNPYPLSPAAGITNPVLRASDVTDRTVSIVFAPFLYHESTNWYMFMCVYGASGDIGLATSTDGLHWTYDRVVLDESFCLSAPQVFKYGNNYYMTTEEYERTEVRLYQATSFPDTWTYVCSLESGRYMYSPTILRYGGTWWLFGYDGSNCRLYYSDSLTDPASWHEHPSSPIVTNDASKARPGGRPIVFNGRIFRFAMKNDVAYGEAVRAFQIDTLSKTSYVEHAIPENPIIRASGSGWNSNGMHWLDPWWVGNRWLVAVDGNDAGGTYAIGIYETQKIQPTIISCDSTGTERNTFNLGETVYVCGSGFDISTVYTYPIYVVGDTTWGEGNSIPSRVSGTEISVSVDSLGRIQAKVVWTQARPGKYDIVVDVDNNQLYNAGVDALDDLDISGAGFFVIPEYVLGTILALGVCFAGVIVYKRSKRHRLKPF